MGQGSRAFLCSLALLALLSAVVVPALAEEPSSVPGKLLVARRAYLIAVSAKQQPANGTVSDDWIIKPIAQTQLATAVTKWSRLEVVDDVSKADLVLLVVEWEDYHRWGNTVVCRDQLLVFDGGNLPNGKSTALWTGDPERWGKFGGCSGAGEPVKELRKLIDKAAKANR